MILDSVGIIKKYLTVKLPKDEFFQECALIVLRAHNEHIPAIGTINTLIGKIARRRNMELRRDNVKFLRDNYTHKVYMYEKYKDAGYKDERGNPIKAPKLPEEDSILDVKTYHHEKQTTEPSIDWSNDEIADFLKAIGNHIKNGDVSVIQCVLKNKSNNPFGERTFAIQYQYRGREEL